MNRGRRARAVRWAFWGMAAGHVVRAVHLRRRRAMLPEVGAPVPDSDGGEAGSGASEVVVLAANGVEVDAATRTAVATEMSATGAQVVDLLPGDLAAEPALRALARVDTERLRTDPMFAPGGAGETLVVHPDVARRMGVTADESLERSDLIDRTVEAQRCAPTAAGVRLAPAVRAGPEGPNDRWRDIEAQVASARPYVAPAPVVVAGTTAHLLALTAGLALAPVPAAVALATWSAQPAAVLGRRYLAPSLLRLPRAWSANVRTALAGAREVAAAAEARAAAPVPLPPPEEDLFEARREACPWCGSSLLVGRVDTPDLLQHKPGRFHLDECLACGHVFQNPALSIAGLDYYYDEFYDGAGGALWEAIFAAMQDVYRQRAEAVAQFTEPRAWLDVGAGHGHFCLTARQRWPEARFDGLDLSESIDEAVRRGWVDAGYRGLFPDLAGGLPQSYDVVSMHHYLEHTRDPRQELAAAVKVLEPGGYLIIEVPDPESPWGRRLGRFWNCWFQPQHQHITPCRNLVAALGDLGFDVVSVERGPATVGWDLALAMVLAVESWAPSPHFPWRPRPSVLDRVKRLAVLPAVLPPALAVATVADAVKDALDRRPGNTAPGNAYRLVARRH